jgi:hypothetical protein
MEASRCTPSILAASAFFACACGGGAPLLHPVHPLATGQISAGAGMSGQFAFGTQGGGGPRGGASADEQRFLDSAVSNAALSPGVAPWVGMRAGLGAGNEGGLTYTGRTARVDARHAFFDDSVALSIGAGASAVLAHPESNAPSGEPSAATAGRFSGTSNELAASGFGIDVPILVGYRSTASVFQAFAGARGGYERVSGALGLGPIVGNSPLDARVIAHRIWTGGLVGMAVGFRPFWVALEVDVAYQAISGSASFPSAAGSPASRDTSLHGLTVAPSGALIGKF